VKQRSARKTAHCRQAPLKHGIYSATIFSARAYVRAVVALLKREPATSPSCHAPIGHAGREVAPKITRRRAEHEPSRSLSRQQRLCGNNSS
jgi:hypothetical protein